MFCNLPKRRIRSLGLILLLGLTIILSLSSINAILQDDIIAYWKLDETTGTVVDSVNGIYDGTDVGGVGRGFSGIISNSFNFTAEADSYVNLTNPTFTCIGDLNCSISIWVNTTFSGDSFIWWQGNQSLNSYFSLLITSSGSIQLQMRNDAGVLLSIINDSANTINNGYWQHIVATFNTTTALLYVNGTLINQSVLSGTFTGGEIEFFGRGVEAGNFYKGLLDEIAIFNKTLTASEVSDLFNNRTGLSYPFIGVDVVLNSPTDNLITAEDNIIFNTTLTPTDVNLTNATFFLWNSTNDIVNETTNVLTGDVANTTLFNITNIAFGIYQWNVLGSGTDSLGINFSSFAPSNFTLTTGFSINNISFNSPVTEGSQQIFSLNLTYSLLTHNLEPKFHYNNTLFSPFISVIGGDTILTNQLLTTGLTTSANRTLFWELDFIDRDTSIVFSFNTTENNQSVLNLDIDDCSVFTNEILNFTMVNEETQVQIVGEVNATTDMDIAVNIFDSLRQSTILEFSNNFTINPVRICLESGLLNDSDYSMDVIVNYEVKGLYASEFYNIVNASLDGNYTARGITLFDLNISDSTVFQLIFTGENYLPEGDVLVNVDRQYIEENVFKTVELPITDFDGKTILNLVRNDVIYNLRMIKNGILIGNFERIRAFCEDPLLQNCQITLAASSDREDFTYDNVTGLIYPSLPIYNANTSTVTFDFIVASGLPKTVRLNVTRSDIFGNRTICENSLTSASGTLICPIDSGLTDTRLLTGVSVNEITVILSTIRINVTDLGTVGYVAWFILTLILIFIFGDTKSGVLISLLVSYIGAAILGINRATILGIGSAGIWIIVITVLGLWRLNREKIQ